MRTHRAPWECTFAEEDKSVCNPGILPGSDQEYFEILCLCILQAGLNWGMVRRNWAKFKKGFYGFDIGKLAKAKVDELLKREGMIRNRKKVQAIINNARKFRTIKQAKGSFFDFLKEMKGKDAIRELVKRFDHIGEYSAEYYLHSVGYQT